LKPKNNSTEILISDNGNTLKKENKHRIFEKFYRIPKGNQHDIKGYGIGLYYTKTIINKHRGTIKVRSEAGKTEFEVCIPIE
jgi:two-component system phosphate regulon sensor histidine kinase PhoR